MSSAQYDDDLRHYPEPELNYLLDDAEADITVFEPYAEEDTTTWLTLRPQEAAIPMEEWR